MKEILNYFDIFLEFLKDLHYCIFISYLISDNKVLNFCRMNKKRSDTYTPTEKGDLLNALAQMYWKQFAVNFEFDDDIGQRFSRFGQWSIQLIAVHREQTFCPLFLKV